MNIGENDINIKVTAENGDIKVYKLTITSEKILSNNKNIKIFVDGNEISFNLFKSQTIHLSNSKDKLNIKYELENKNATVKIIGNNNLKAGENKVVVRVTAENGEECDYVLIVNKYEKIEETIIDVIAYIVIFVYFGGIGYLFYFFIKLYKKISKK